MATARDILARPFPIPMNEPPAMSDQIASSQLDRRAALQCLTAGFLTAGFLSPNATWAIAADPSNGVADALPADPRLGPLKDLNGYFPFEPSKSPEEWQRRAEYVRRQILVAAGLWPMPIKRDIQAHVHGRVDRDEYSVERVSFESSPGLYVTGSLYRPREKSGPLPAVLCPHGHWPGGRFHDHGENRVKSEIEAGAEKFPRGGRYPLQARCVQLARMGCLVFHYDMLGYADSTPFSYELVHRFAKQREHMSDAMNWGLFSAQAELRLVNVLGLQTWNSIRALDWICSLEEVDVNRIGVTGASGGGTQTFLLAAVDERPAAAFPAVMVSTAMQGGCTCENACYLRIDTGNIEFAALCAPRPLGMSAANDWTQELETKGLPELKQQYRLLGAPDAVVGKHFNFPHNYNYVARAMMYDFFNRHLKLGATDPIVETDFEPLTQAELTVWTSEHPRPEISDDAERKAAHAFYADAVAPIQSLVPRDKQSWDEYRRVIGDAVEVMVGHGLPAAADIERHKISEKPIAGGKAYFQVLRNREHGSLTPCAFLMPEKWNNQVAIWVHDDGKAGICDAEGQPTPGAQKLLESGMAVAGLDLLHQGEQRFEGQDLEQARTVNNPREFAGFTLGYNHPLVAQRVHDVLTLVSFCRNYRDQPQSVHLLGLGEVAPVVAAAAGLAGEAVTKVAIGTDGFRFASITDIRDPKLWPGAVKYGDVPGLLSLCAPHPLWLSGEGGRVPELVANCYRAAGNANGVMTYGGDKSQAATAAVKWLLGNTQ